jgi:glycerol-3-phosphate dehydrogenase
MPSPVLIIGAGINGAAIARELVQQRIPMIVVDQGDIASGATAYSSRLIHGGLRYLEYGEFDLVRESLEERTHWLAMAPDFVQPMRFVIPVQTRFGGLWNAASRFLNLPNSLSGKPAKNGRGLWTIRMGLKFYDIYARDKTLPRSCVLSSEQKLPLNPDAAHWQCEYSDAQMLYPERFTVALFQDAAQIAAENGTQFELHTYHQVELRGKQAILKKGAHSQARTQDISNEEVKSWEPPLIINASGAWVDRTLKGLHVESKQLMGGTKGSHFLTSHSGLCEIFHGASVENLVNGPRAVYAEASDGRPVFLIPFANRVLVGTTDEPFLGDPAEAVATPAELEYLVGVVNHLFPHVSLKTTDIDQHYCGVRPLPFVGPSSPSAITRRHWIEQNDASPIPLISIIGGKLTTCRVLAREVVETVCIKLDAPFESVENERPLHDPIKSCSKPPLGTDIFGNVEFGREMIRRAIREEWITCLEDLVERRLMTVFNTTVNRDALVTFAKLMSEEGKINSNDIESQVDQVISTWARRYGKKVV